MIWFQNHQHMMILPISGYTEYYICYVLVYLMKVVVKQTVILYIPISLLSFKLWNHELPFHRSHPGVMFVFLQFIIKLQSNKTFNIYSYIYIIYIYIYTLQYNQYNGSLGSNLTNIGFCLNYWWICSINFVSKIQLYKWRHAEMFYFLTIKKDYLNILSPLLSLRGKNYSPSQHLSSCISLVN